MTVSAVLGMSVAIVRDCCCVRSVGILHAREGNVDVRREVWNVEVRSVRRDIIGACDMKKTVWAAVRRVRKDNENISKQRSGDIRLPRKVVVSRDQQMNG